MENRLLRLELAMLLEEASKNYKNMNQNKLKKHAVDAAIIALRLGTHEAAMTAAVIRDMEVNSRKYKKKGRFLIKNTQSAR